VEIVEESQELRIAVSPCTRCVCTTFNGTSLTNIPYSSLWSRCVVVVYHCSYFGIKPQLNDGHISANSLPLLSNQSVTVDSITIEPAGTTAATLLPRSTVPAVAV
jgi:hypothetical protein